MLDGGEFLVIAKHGASLAALYPGITILGDFGGNLSSSSDNIVLLDENKNIADEVRYFDGGYWHDAADGGGGSLELRDPYADNTKAEAWAPSDESASSPWQTYQYTMTATQPVWQPSISFHELRVGLLTGGEVWIDDVSVIRDPGGANVELMQNGSFGTGSDKWRLLGTHSNSEIIDDGGNNVMRIVADGPMNYLNNRLESTLAFGEQVQNGVDYKISYRAKWIWGSNQLHTELYYNRVVKTTHIEAPQLNGTPGAENSRYIANAGPTYDAFQHGPVVPDVGEDVTVSAVINDPDGVDPATAKVWWSVDGGAWSSSPMTDQGAGLYSGQVPGQAAGVVVQFYVEAADLLGAVSTFPAAGPDSRALFEVQDNRAQLGTKHNVRFIMLSSEASAMTPLTNILSNQRIGTTVVYNESEVFYDAGVRLRGSMFSRNGQNGFNIGLQPHQLFRGVHDSITLKRSGTQEIVVKHMNAKAGGIPAMYDDVVRIISSVNNITGNGTMSMARFGDDFLDSQYDNGSDGTVFKMEGIRVITSTVDGNPESLKVAFPVGWVGGFDMTDQGDDPEQYRWTWKINNNRREDNYDPMVALAKTLSLNGQELEDAIAEVMDVNQLTRVFAMLSLAGIGDTYTQGNPHNFNVYSPADGGPMIAMPWDWDFTFNRGTSSPLWGNKNLSKVFARPKYTRLFMGNMLDLIEKTYNTDYMTDWINHYGSLLGINLGGYPGYITNRTNFVQSQFPAETAFAITTPEPVTESGLTTTLQGNAWIDVKEFRIAGVALPLDVSWSDTISWQATVPIELGTNELVLEAYDFDGQLIGSDTITVTSTAIDAGLRGALRITELNYNPVDATPAELATQSPTDDEFDNDDFEFIELQNTGTDVLDLTNVQFIKNLDDEGVVFQFTPSADDTHLLLPDQHVLVVANQTAFEARYGAGLPVAGVYEGGLKNSGEAIILIDSRLADSRLHLQRFRLLAGPRRRQGLDARGARHERRLQRS